MSWQWSRPLYRKNNQQDMYRPFATADGLFSILNGRRNCRKIRGGLFLITVTADRTVIKGGIDRIEILAVQMILDNAQSFTETGRLK